MSGFRKRKGWDLEMTKQGRKHILFVDDAAYHKMSLLLSDATNQI